MAGQALRAPSLRHRTTGIPSVLLPSGPRRDDPQLRANRKSALQK
uniref:Uncharacterized protein n=1 Tax=Trichinella nativa TaxID=6335 RepID=A0A0V1KI95_9BILA